MFNLRIKYVLVLQISFYQVFGDTQWRTFEQLGEMAHCFGAALRKCGVQPQPSNAETEDHNVRRWLVATFSW
jgi:hypothetical protein